MYADLLPVPAPPPGPRSGTVYLVGAGPGDPDLLTVRARDLLRHAGLVLYDNLTSPEVLALAGAAAELRYVGKKRSAHACTQVEINDLMVAAARAGRTVVRLKGGDPYIFGRGGEEAQALARSEIPFEVVPGISSALGAAAYAGLPLTHRDHTQAVTLLTGHDVDLIDWVSLAQKRQTVVIFMGLTSFAEIARRLREAGMPSHTPAAAVRWATRGDQVVLTGTLDGLPVRIGQQGLRPPALVVIGEIVRLRSEVDWFGRRPLRGQSVVVTRAATQSLDFCRLLRRLGARVVPIPMIEFAAPDDWGPADRAIRNLQRYDWIVFTSVNGVERFVQRLDGSARDLRSLPRRICAIGPATAERLRALHLRVDLVPERYVAESLSEAFESLDLDGRRILLPRAQEARDLLPRKLGEGGAEVDVVPVYRTLLPEASRQAATRVWGGDRAPNWVTATSSSTITNLRRIVDLEDLRRSRLASIGPVTSATARQLGLRVAVEAEPFTTEALAQALCSAVAPDKP